ncbi:integrase catalytic domain-containing protein [Nephila pilipes]|uniref:Integrase catalytic domain-containing protein n=1 Tax=Nephila pilipes TaxID=299642 RepID=A0A8X6PW87_NEPPI|nr:integrase catalytic domain-containing protein [Nephila pilipes]
MWSIKESLRNTLGRALVTPEELSTVLTEIENAINYRMITYDSDELGEPRALTPSHFLLPSHRDSGFLPEHFLGLFVSASDRVTLSKHKLFQTKILKQLWVKWKTEYLLQLQSAHSLLDPSSYSNLKIGDIALVEGVSKLKLL